MAENRITQEFIEVAYETAPPANNARLTQEFAEVGYRDPIVAAPARITQEFIEVAYREPPPTNYVRLTQQSVEVLYLTYDTVDPFDACGHFTGIREFDVRVFDDMDPDTGVRKAYGPDGEDLTGLIASCSFEIQERGGYGGGTLEFLAPWEDVTLAGTERVDVWLWDQPVWRGYLRIAQRDIGSPESARPQMYGMVAIMDQWKVRRKYAYGCDTDVATIARDILLDHVTVTGRFPNASIDASTAVGSTLREYDGRGKSVAQALNELADFAPNQAIWGVEMDTARPIPGDTIYFRPRPTDTAYVVAVGDNVSLFSYPLDTHTIVNSLKVTGGEVTQPNLALNGSFEEVMPASEDNGNHLLNPSFEDGATNWTLSAGSTVQFPGNGGAHGSARTGSHWLELDVFGEEAEQTVGVVPELEYTASVWARLEDASNGNSGFMEFEGYDASNVLVVAASSVPIDPSTEVYERFTSTLDLASYPTVVKLKITLGVNGGTATNDGILFDDAGIYVECGVAQQTWQFTPTGAATIDELDWNYSGPVVPRTGKYCVHMNCSDIALVADTGELYYFPSKSPSVQPNERYTLIVWWQTNGEGTPADDALTIGAVSIDSSNVQGTVFESDTIVIPGTAPTTWQMASLDIITESTTARLQVFIRVRTNVNIYLDDVMLVQGEAPAEVRDSGGYWTGTTYERYIDVEDALLTGDYALNTGVGDSITTYGEHEDDAQNDLVKDLNTALAFAAGKFNALGLPRVQAELEIFGARQIIGQEGLLRLVNIPNAPDPLWPARASYTVRPESIDVRVELGNERPYLQGLLALTTKQG